MSEDEANGSEGWLDQDMDEDESADDSASSSAHESNVMVKGKEKHTSSQDQKRKELEKRNDKQNVLIYVFCVSLYL